MRRIKIRKGLNLPITGKPLQKISTGKKIRQVALLGADYIGLKPRFCVAVGDNVKLGQLLFYDKKMESLKFTSPGAGKVTAINRGEKRKFLSIVIDLAGENFVTFRAHSEEQLSSISRKDAVSQLLECGLWTALRSRPFGSIADPESEPHSIFITAMDSNPLSPDMEVILNDRENDFRNGLHILTKLTEGRVNLCKAPFRNIPVIDSPKLSVFEFDGPHPAGNAGTHIHFIDPVNREKQVWYIGAQDVCTIGCLFTSGKLNVERVISLAGSSVDKPRLIKTRMGGSITDLTDEELKTGDNRIISGSVLSGYKIEEATAFLGRYHQQVSVIPEFSGLGSFAWLSPGFKKYSVKNIFLSRLFPKKQIDFTTAAHGGLRAIVPIESYEKVMPLDILPTYLLRALAVDDIDEAERLGCLELEEEDLSLCTFVCPSKIDHPENLRRNLNIIKKEG